MIKCIAALVLLVVSTGVHAETSKIVYEKHSYETGTFYVNAPFSTVKERLTRNLAPFTAADAYKKYDSGASHEDFNQGNGPSIPYMVYEVRWEVPIFIDTGERHEQYRIGLGGGPGRPLLAKYPKAGTHVLPTVHLWAEDNRTGVSFVLPSSQYRAAYGQSSQIDALGREADARLMKLIETLH